MNDRLELVFAKRIASMLEEKLEKLDELRIDFADWKSIYEFFKLCPSYRILSTNDYKEFISKLMASSVLCANDFELEEYNQDITLLSNIIKYTESQDDPNYDFIIAAITSNNLNIDGMAQGR